MRPFFALTALALFVGACQQVPRPPQARKLRILIAERLPVFQVEKRPEAERRFPEAAVYLDGKPIGVIKHSYLPTTLKSHKKVLEAGYEVTRYRMVEYLESIGVKMDKIRELHLIGGRGRVAILPADEIRKHRDDLLFAFTRGN